jgi:hypothetical protein
MRTRPVALPSSHPASRGFGKLVHFIARGLFGLLTWWMHGKMRLPVEEMNALFWRLAIPAMKTTVR